MSDKKDGTSERVAALEREVAELKAKVDPPKSTFKEMSDAEWRDHVHQMRERQANSWMPPSAVQEMVAAEPRGFMREVAMRDARAPNSPGTIPRSEQPSNVRPDSGPANTTGWRDATPIGPQPGIQWVDAQCIADDVRQRAELARKLGKG
jgi:hypothetical protein